MASLRINWEMRSRLPGVASQSQGTPLAEALCKPGTNVETIANLRSIQCGSEIELTRNVELNRDKLIT